MDQKRFVNIALIVLTIALVGIAGYFVLNNRSAMPTPILSPTPTITPEPATTQTPPVSLLRVCPEEWHDNRMPSIVGSDRIPNEYFIYNGARRELSEFDINWVKTNCSVKPQIVY